MINVLKLRENRAIFFSIANIFIKMLVSLVTVPITIGIFGKEMNGIWSAALSIMTFVNFLDAGLTPSIINRLSVTFNKCDNKGFKEAYNLGVYVGITVISLSILGSIFIEFIDLYSIFNWSRNINGNEVVWLFRIVLITTGIIIGTSIFENVLFSVHMGDIPRIASIISNIMGLIMILLVSKFKISIIALALIIQFPKFVYRIGLMIYIKFKLKISIFPLVFIQKKYLLELFNSSGLFIFIQIFQWLYSSAASIIIPKFIGLNDYSNFCIQFMPFNIILTMIASLQPIFWPKLLNLYQDKKSDELIRKIRRLIIFSSIFISIFSIVYMILGPIFIKIYSKDTVIFEYKVTFNLSIWLIIQSMVWWLSTFLHGIEDLKFEIILFLLSSMSLIGTSYLINEKINVIIFIKLMWMSILIFNLIPMFFRVKNVIIKIKRE